MTIFVVNGPNLNLLGEREPDVYGHDNYLSLVLNIKKYAKEKKIKIIIKQSNHEGEIIDLLQKYRKKIDGIVINPGAYTHYSYAIYDCIKGISVPAVEVHLSDIESREEFRKISVIKPACIGQIKGKGIAGYREAIDMLLERKV